MSKSAFADFLGCSRANVTKLTGPGGKCAAAVNADGLVDVDLALRLRAEHTDPVRDAASRLPGARSGPVAAEAGELAGELGGTEPPGGYLASRARKAAADAEVAEFVLAEKRGQLVGAPGVKAGAKELGELLLQGLEDAFADCASRSRQAATVGDAMNLAKRLARAFGESVQSSIGRAVREMTSDG